MNKKIVTNFPFKYQYSKFNTYLNLNTLIQAMPQKHLDIFPEAQIS